MAGFRVTGDFNRLAGLIRRFQVTASPQSYHALLQKLALDYLDQVEQRFDTATDPNGVPWAPLADGSGRKPLTKTGALRHSFYADVRGNGQAVIGSRIPYSGFHQSGTRNMPARMMVPASIAGGGSAKQTGQTLRALMRRQQRIARAAARAQFLAGTRPARSPRTRRSPRAAAAAGVRTGGGRAAAGPRGFDLIAWMRRIGLLFLRRAVRAVLPG